MANSCAAQDDRLSAECTVERNRIGRATAVAGRRVAEDCVGTGRLDRFAETDNTVGIRCGCQGIVGDRVNEVGGEHRTVFERFETQAATRIAAEQSAPLVTLQQPPFRVHPSNSFLVQAEPAMDVEHGVLQFARVGLNGNRIKRSPGTRIVIPELALPGQTIVTHTCDDVLHLSSPTTANTPNSSELGSGTLADAGRSRQPRGLS